MLTVQFKLLISDTIKNLGRSVFSINNLCFSLIVNKWCYLSVGVLQYCLPVLQFFGSECYHQLVEGTLNLLSCDISSVIAWAWYPHHEV